MNAEIIKADQIYKNTIQNLKIDIIQNNKLNKTTLSKNKHLKITGDAILQLLFQAAYHLQYGKMPSIYESANMLAFKNGRTETIRPTTQFSKEFVQLFNSNNYNKNEILKSLKTASDFHNLQIINVLKGI